SKDGREHASADGVRAVPAVAAFDTGGEVVRDGIFEAAANRRAPHRLAARNDGRREDADGDEVGADRQVGERGAARYVKQDAIPGVADTAARGAFPAASPLEAIASDEREREHHADRVYPRPALPVDIALDAE